MLQRAPCPQVSESMVYPDHEKPLILMKKFVKTLRAHEDLLLNYFRAKNNSIQGWQKGSI